MDKRRDVMMIVVKCTTNDCPRPRSIYGDFLHNVNYLTLDHAMAVGKSMLCDGVCVIVRPCYNEEDEKGKFFREWRSFNGSSLEECRWRF